MPELTALDRLNLQKVTSIMLRAAEAEAARPRQLSKMEDLAGTKYESPNEKLERILTAAVTCGMEQGMLSLPPDVEDRLKAYLVIDRPF